MTRLKLSILLLVSVLLGPTRFAMGQALSKIAVVDFERAVVECAEGKKSSERFNTKLEEKRKDVEKRQKELDDAQKKLQTQERALSEPAKVELQKDIDRKQTELTRINEDAQKELEGMRNELLRPIAERASAILNTIAVEQSYTVVVDVSNAQNSVLWFNPKDDITAELTRRIDATAPKTEAPAAARPPAAAAPRPAAPAAPAPAVPKKP